MHIYGSKNFTTKDLSKYWTKLNLKHVDYKKINQKSLCSVRFWLKYSIILVRLILFLSSTISLVDDNIKIKQFIENTSKELNGSIEVKKFVRFKVGEGI